MVTTLKMGELQEQASPGQGIRRHLHLGWGREVHRTAVLCPGLSPWSVWCWSGSAGWPGCCDTCSTFTGQCHSSTYTLCVHQLTVQHHLSTHSTFTNIHTLFLKIIPFFFGPGQHLGYYVTSLHKWHGIYAASLSTRWSTSPPTHQKTENKTKTKNCTQMKEEVDSHFLNTVLIDLLQELNTADENRCNQVA